MKESLGQYGKLIALAAPLLPDGFSRREAGRREYETLFSAIVLVLDAITKADPGHRGLHPPRPAPNSWFSPETRIALDNLAFLLTRFNSPALRLSRTDRQTLVFILENMADYFQRLDAEKSEKSRAVLFQEYRFWLDSFFKLIQQKMQGELQAADESGADPFFSSPNDCFPLAPFMLSDGAFLCGLAPGKLIYRLFNSDKTYASQDREMTAKVSEFLLENLLFENWHELAAGNDHPLPEKWRLLKRALEKHQGREFQASHDILASGVLDNCLTPPAWFLQARNFIYLKQFAAARNHLEKILNLFPWHADGFEMMADICLREENQAAALNYYDRALQLSLTKPLTEKVRRVREMSQKGPEKAPPGREDTLYDLSETAVARQAELLPRPAEVNRMLEVLAGDSRRNLLLVGEPGVGKSSLVELLALRLASGEVPPALRGLRIKEINYVSLLVGAKYRGQFEERVLSFLNDFKGRPAILLLEDIHLMVSGMGSRATTLDLVNILKPFLRDKSIQVIATTEYEEFKNVLEKDSSFLRHFQRITVREMGEGDCLLLLQGAARKLLQENIVLPYRLLPEIVENAALAIRSRRLPDSALLLLERMTAKLIVADEQGGELGEKHLEAALADLLNLDPDQGGFSRRLRLQGLRRSLMEKIIGQDDALARLADCIIAAKSGFRINSQRPQGVFLFIGPTGVGKTETALVLSEILLGSRQEMIRLDMSEYMERFTFSRFVGAAPGYVGYYDSNQLTDRVRQQPFAVILLDEVEKADPQILNLFLQIFDAGRLTDARGNTVDFSHTLVIMTSNVGTSLYGRTGLGYQPDSSAEKVSGSALQREIKRFFSPEFLNRIDEVIAFRPLEETDVLKIARLELEGIRRKLRKQGKDLELGSGVEEFLARLGYSSEYGARNLNRVLRREILEKVAPLSLTEDWSSAALVICRLAGSELSVELTGTGEILAACSESEELQADRVQFD